MVFAHFARDSTQGVLSAPRSRFVTGSRTLAEHGCRGSTGEAPVLFLHGWGVGPHSYDAPLTKLRDMGFAVEAPALPGFGGAPGLGPADCDFPGYARWVASYLDDLRVEEPVVVVGHSFGGGVAVQFAHDHRDRVHSLVLCNAVGGFPWAVHDDGDEAVSRPLWQWGRFLADDLLALPALPRVLPALLSQAVSNLVQNPRAMWQVAEFVRKADLLAEIGTVSRSGVPISIVWSDRDRLVPHAGFSALCRAAGVGGRVVPGNHSWLIAEPRAFADLAVQAMAEAGAFEYLVPAAG